MTKIKSLTLSALVAASTLAVAPAFAFQLSPDGSFVATGPTSLTASGLTVPCTSTFQLSVVNGVGQVVAASFSGAGTCGLVAAQGLPWAVQTPDAATLIINNVRVSVTGTAIVCGPSAVTGTLSNSVYTFNSVLNPGNCAVSGMLTITPTLSIVP